MNRPTGAEAISAERLRQQQVEGFTAERDDLYDRRELVRAAMAYIAVEQPSSSDRDRLILDWPWSTEWFKPHVDRTRNLVKAGALIAAEIDRINRLGTKMNCAKAPDGRWYGHRNCTFILVSRGSEYGAHAWSTGITHGCWCSAWRQLKNGQMRIWRAGAYRKPRPGELRRHIPRD